jgi:hypothetical protein
MLGKATEAVEEALVAVHRRRMGRETRWAQSTAIDRTCHERLVVEECLDTHPVAALVEEPVNLETGC